MPIHSAHSTVGFRASVVPGWAMDWAVKTMLDRRILDPGRGNASEQLLFRLFVTRVPVSPSYCLNQSPERYCSDIIGPFFQD